LKIFQTNIEIKSYFFKKSMEINGNKKEGRE